MRWPFDRRRGKEKKPMIRRRMPWAVTVLGAAMALGCEETPTSPDERMFSETETASFAVADSSSAVVDTFVGAIIVSQAAADSVQVVATRQADRQEDLAAVLVEMSLQDNVVQLTAANPSNVQGVSVDFDLTGPADMNLELRTGVGAVACQGRPTEDWLIDVGVGNIALVVPDDLNATVDLRTGVGSVEVEFPVTGSVSSGSVIGVIGTGADGVIVADCGVGNIALLRESTSGRSSRRMVEE
jgi:hypothetical protein